MGPWPLDAPDERVTAAVLRAERLLATAGAQTTPGERRRARRLGRLLADDRRARAAVRPHRRGAAHARPAAVDGPAPRPRRRRPAPALSARRSRRPAPRRARLRVAARPGGGHRAATHPRRDARRHHPRRRPGLRPPRRAPPRRGLRRQRQPARRGDPRRRRGPGPPRRAVRPDAPARRRLRLGEDLGAVRQPRRAGLRPRGRPHRRPPAHGRLRRRRAIATAGVRQPRHGGVPRPPPHRRRLPPGARRAERSPTSRPASCCRPTSPTPTTSLDELLAWAARRHRAGGAPVKVRLVKGANLAMEHVDAELGGWTPAPYATKADVDASYKALLDRLLDARRARRARRRRRPATTCSTSPGRSASATAAASTTSSASRCSRAWPRRRPGRPARTPAACCCTRRSSPTRTSPPASPTSRGASTRTPGRRTSCARCSRSRPARRSGTASGGASRPPSPPPGPSTDGRAAPRTGAPSTAAFDPDAPFANEPDTDFTQAANRRLDRRTAWTRSDPPRSRALITTIDGDRRRRRAGRGRRRTLGGDDDRRAAAGARPGRRGDGRRARPDARRDGPRDRQDRPRGRPRGVRGDRLRPLGGRRARARSTSSPPTASPPTRSASSLVAGPWNFPTAIPANGVVAALAAGNAVLLKPAPEAVATAVELVRHAPRGRHPRRRRAARALPRRRRRPPPRHPPPASTPSCSPARYDTARLFLDWRPELRLLAETSGKNALVISQTADVDLALRDLVRSAFGHAGQKCSAASLAIVEAPLYDDPLFLRRLADAVRSLRVGPATDLATMVGPVIAPPSGALARALHDARRRRVLARRAAPPRRAARGRRASASASAPARGSTAPSASGRCSA